MLGAPPPDTIVQRVARPATPRAWSTAWGWKPCMHFSWWQPFLALGERDTRGDSLITWEDLANLSAVAGLHHLRVDFKW